MKKNEGQKSKIDKVGDVAAVDVDDDATVVVDDDDVGVVRGG